MLTDDQLLEIAGKPALTRGQAYHRERRIALSHNDADTIEGTAKGTQPYALWLKRDGTRWRWGCNCRAADDGAFCKHLVAAVLTARGDAPDEVADPVSTKEARAQVLAEFLRAQPTERMAERLVELANKKKTAAVKRARLHSAIDDPAELKAALGKMLDPGGFLDYRRSNDYARRLDAVVTQLERAIARDADSGRGLCEYALGRLLKIYPRSDDSGGAIGAQVAGIARLHAHACALEPPGKSLGKMLLSLQQKDDWGMFPLNDYWLALGADGQTDYATRVLAEFGTLPQKPSEASRWNESFGIARRTEALARASGDFELLQRVLRRHLSHPRDHLRVFESLNEFGRAREAQAWIEKAVKRFPDDDGLRGALADCLAGAGLDEDAIEQAWRAFRLRPVEQNWDLLKRISGTDWAMWRERVIEHVRSIERGDASHRITLLEHDGDIDAAVFLARESEVRPDVLERLARHLQRDQPLLAGEFELRIARMQMVELQPTRYAALVTTVKRAARCLSPEHWKPLVADIRAEHGKKSKLMRLLDEANL